MTLILYRPTDPHKAMGYVPGSRLLYRDDAMCVISIRKKCDIQKIQDVTGAEKVEVVGGME